MGIEDNRAQVLGFLADWSAGRFEAAFARAADTLEWRAMFHRQFTDTPPRGRQSFIDTFRRLGSLFQDGMQMHPVSSTAEADRVSVEVLSSGRLSGSGEEYRNTYHFLFTLAGGLIVRVNAYLDTDHAYQVLAKAPGVREI
jgi:ketosteroid isomerase-like protein